MKTVVINRKLWGTGTLLNGRTGKKCCLGFVSKAYGVSSEKMMSHALPSDLPESEKLKLPKWLCEFNDDSGSNKDVYKASEINDTIRFTWAEKEEELRPIFRKHKIKLVFRGKR